VELLKVPVSVLVSVLEEVMAADPVPERDPDSAAVPDPVGLGMGLELLDEVGVPVPVNVEVGV